MIKFPISLIKHPLPLSATRQILKYYINMVRLSKIVVPACICKSIYIFQRKS